MIPKKFDQERIYQYYDSDNPEEVKTQLLFLQTNKSVAFVLGFVGWIYLQSWWRKIWAWISLITFSMKERFNILYVIYCIVYHILHIPMSIRLTSWRSASRRRSSSTTRSTRAFSRRSTTTCWQLPAPSYQNTAKQYHRALSYLTTLALVYNVLSLRFAKSSKRERRSQKPLRHEEDVKIFAN